MKLSSREMVLSGITGLVVLVGLSYWVGKPKIDTWKELAANRQAVEHRVKLSKRVIEQRGQWDARLDTLRTRLSKYPADKDATADYLRILERVANENKVKLARRKARKEKSHGDLYELAIDCTWEAELDALVRFLCALEQEDVTMDMEDLAIAFVSGSKGQLKGDFTLICVYTRDADKKDSDAGSGTPSNPEKS